MLRRIISNAGKGRTFSTRAPKSFVPKPAHSLSFRLSHRTITENLSKLEHPQDFENQSENEPKSTSTLTTLLLTGAVVAGVSSHIYKELYLNQLKKRIQSGDHKAIEDFHSDKHVHFNLLLTSNDALKVAKSLTKNDLTKLSLLHYYYLLEMLPANERLDYLKMTLDVYSNLIDLMRLQKNSDLNVLSLFTKIECLRIILESDPEKLKETFNHASLIKKGYKALAKKDREKLTDILGEHHIARHIETYDDLTLLNFLTTHSQEAVVKQLGITQLKNLIHSSQHLYLRVNHEAYQAVIHYLGPDYLKSLITQPDILLRMANQNELSPQKYHTVLDTLGKDYVSSLIQKSSHDISEFKLPAPKPNKGFGPNRMLRP